MDFQIPRIAPTHDTALRQQLQSRVDGETKPLGALGRLESLAVQLGDESGHALMLKHLGAQPLLDLGLRLGEGSGAAPCCVVSQAGWISAMTWLSGRAQAAPSARSWPAAVGYSTCTRFAASVVRPKSHNATT